MVVGVVPVRDLAPAAVEGIAPALRRLEPHPEGTTTPASRLGWACLGAVAVLTLELLGFASGLAAGGAVGALLLVFLALGRLLPGGTLTGRPGLPAGRGDAGDC